MRPGPPDVAGADDVVLVEELDELDELATDDATTALAAAAAAAEETLDEFDRVPDVPGAPANELSDELRDDPGKSIPCLVRRVVYSSAFCL